MKSRIGLLASIGLLALVAVGSGIVYYSSNLACLKATVTFSVNEKRVGMNTLTAEAPYGYYIIRYSVVPRSPANDESPFSVGGKGVAQSPIGLFGNKTEFSNMFPSEGKVEDIPLEQHVRIASNLNYAATAEMPTNQKIRDRCGIYVLVTKDRSQFEKLDSVVKGWKIEEPANSLDLVK